MVKADRPSRGAALSLALFVLWTPGMAPAQPATRNQVLIDAVTSNPADAPRLAAQEVVAGGPDSAPPIVGDVVHALPPDRRLSLAPRVVSAAIAALPAPQRAPQAPAIACAAIRAVPADEQPAVVVPIVAAAAAMAPTASPRIVACATDAVSGSSAAIIAAAGLASVQPDVLSTPSAPQPGTSIGRDILLQTQPRQILTCASPPCP
jgi:hypothetical protein